jgi:hypothetical protein
MEVCTYREPLGPGVAGTPMKCGPVAGIVTATACLIAGTDDPTIPIATNLFCIPLR